MDFFRSILADDPDPETPDSYEESDPDPRQIQSPKHQQIEGEEDDYDDSTSNINSSEDGIGGGIWSFGDLVKTLTTKSESVLETYRRDLKEFGTGLRKESDLFREVASRAVKELPASIEVGTSAIDGVLKSTADMIAQGKEVLLAPSDVDSDVSEMRTSSDRSGFDSVRYSRFDAQLNAIRSDARGYCEDPEDIEDYNNWKLGFVVGDKKDEIEKLVGEDGALEGIYSKVVPNEVDDATFWFRYFYKVHKLRQQEEMRAKLVNRSLSVDDEEELSWDVDDDDDNEEEEEQLQQQKQKQEDDQIRSNTSKSQDSGDVIKKESPDDEIKTQSSEIVDGDKELTTNVVSELSVDKNIAEEPKLSGGDVSTVEKAESVAQSDEKVDLKVDSDEIKDSNVAVKSNQPSFQDDEDLEWDEIEDLGKNDDQNVTHDDTTNKAELRKRLSTAADEDEDLSWDIEDDDEPLKPGNK
ncbi:hypothetical protein SSX86_022127 [Deinandra increscens subsp. villosa]|uniref:BSD domain-containing protein n=1 Tax=Deinandra increscens subsp. villosa TaxID=3103831 RepID=A0AAP0CNQ2_9ASTR